MREYSIASVDAGGTNLDGAAVSSEGGIIKEHRFVSPSEATAEEICDSFVELILNLAEAGAAAGIPVEACAVGMPGPFDYATGISYMDHKFQALAQEKFNLKEALYSRLDLPIFFINDGDAFGLGASKTDYPQAERLVGVALGTGPGSGFVKNGRLTHAATGVPPQGEIWDIPYGGRILENFIGAKAIQSFYEQFGGKAGVEVIDIAARAFDNDSAALAAWAEFTSHLGQGLALALKDFEPEEVVFGGKISRSFALFGSKAEQIYKEKTNSQTRFSHVKKEAASLIGLAYFAFESLQRNAPN